MRRLKIVPPLTSRRPRPPEPPPTHSFGDKLQLLALTDPQMLGLLERVVDGLLDDQPSVRPSQESEP